MFCEKCGKELKDDWKKCPYCGQTVGKDDVKMGGETKMSGQVEPARSENRFSGKEPKKTGRIKNILLGIGAGLVILVVLSIIFSPGSEEKGDSRSSGDTQEATAEVKTLEEMGGFAQWQEDGFPGRVRANISIDFPLLNTDKNHYGVYIGVGGINIGVIMQEDEKPVKEWEWLMNAEPYEDTQKAYFNGILKYLGQKDDGEMPVFLISDIGEGDYLGDGQETESKADIDLEGLIGQPEEELKNAGFTYDEDGIGYELLDGKVIADCMDGKVYMILLTGSGEEMLNFHGVKVGMTLEEADALLEDKYSKAGELEGKTAYIDLEARNGIGLVSTNGRITEIDVTHFTEEELQEYMAVTQEYIFPDSNSRYLSEEEIRSIEADRLRIARNEIFARHGYIFDSEELQQYFNSTSWYVGTVPAEQFNMDETLNDFEKKNVELIEKVENELNGGNNGQETFIGRAGAYLTPYDVNGFTPRIDILEIGEDALTFTLGVLGHPTNMLEESAQIIDSNTAQLDYYGFIITFTWTDEGSIHVTHQGELTGMDSGVIMPATDGQEYIWAEEFN